jgi:hypothetical protein
MISSWGDDHPWFVLSNLANKKGKVKLKKRRTHFFVSVFLPDSPKIRTLSALSWMPDPIKRFSEQKKRHLQGDAFGDRKAASSADFDVDLLGFGFRRLG